MTTALLPAQRAALRTMTRGHKGDTMITFLYPTTPDPDPAPSWYVQRQLDTALQQARDQEAKTMTVPTHTPGPWAMEQPYGEPGTYISRPETTELIAKLYPPDNPRETQPNARLIAAAPELLAALVGLLRAEEITPGECYTNGIPNANWGAVAMAKDTARAAIAKATGEGRE